MKRFSQTIKVAMALFVGMFSNGLIPAAQASAYSTKPYESYDKVYVCKYVGTPGVDEHLQTGDNPISVSKNSIANFSGLGSYFNDNQGRSYVVAWDNRDHREPPISMCPAPSTTTIIAIPAIPTMNDPCGSNNAAWVVPPDTLQIHWVLSQSGVLSANTKQGYVFSDQTTSHSYGKAIDSNTACIIQIDIPKAPDAIDPCGLNNATWVLPPDTISYSWSLVDGHLIVTAKQGYIFKGNVTSYDYGKAVDSGRACVIEIPATPSTTDPCGPRNAAWILPEDTDQIHWVLSYDGSLTAYAKPGYVFSDKTTSHNYGKPKDSNAPCVIAIPEAPKTHDPCGLHNADWIIPHDTNEIDWSLNYKGELLASAKSGFVFSDGKTVHNYGQAPDSGELCRAEPQAPTFVDYCGTQTDYVVIPSVKGVTYKINGKPVHAGYQAVHGTVLVTVVADKDYVLVGEERGPWTFTSLSSECITITKTSKPVTDTNNNGTIGVGDTVTWVITVTNNSDNDYDNFRVELDDASATLVDNDAVVGGVIKYLKHGTSVTVEATSVLTVSDVQACKASNTVTFMAWFNRKHHDLDNYGHDSQAFSLRHDNDDETEYDITGSADAEATFTCPTPGSGSGGGTTTTSTTSETPSVLPSTGPNDSNPMLIFAGSAIAYIATYLIQRRRELMSN